MAFTDVQIRDLFEGVGEVDEKVADLREGFVLRRFRTAEAREHADHGFARRVGSLARCIERVFEVLPPDRRDIPDRSETEDATINIQAFLMNAFGCCENLAWIWVFERDVRRNDGSEVPPGLVGLGPKCRELRRSFSPEFRAYLHSRRAWFDHLKDFRDALAHRIPLYIPPFVVEPADAERWRALGNAADVALLEGRLGQEQELRAEQAVLKHFNPIMTHSLVDGGRPVVFHYQLLADFNTIHEIANEFLRELER